MYDLIIIGGGPAGLTASIYASCYHLSHVIISKTIGGQLLLAPDILNYPGFDSISGKELTERMLAQAKSRGAHVVPQAVEKITKIDSSTNGKNGTGYEVKTEKGEIFQGKSLILATGTERRKLGVPGEVEYTAKGVHYCATCEKFDYEGKICAVVGGANSAVQAAVELAQAAAKVYILYRGSELRGDPIWVSQAEKHDRVEIRFHTQVAEIVGNGTKVTGVKVKTQSPGKNSEESLLPLDKVFIEIGGVPGTALVIPIGVTMDAGGYIKVDEHLATTAAGVFAAGDLVSYGLSIEQISSAVGLGARAASSAFAYIKEEKKAPTLWGGSQIQR